MKRAFKTALDRINDEYTVKMLAELILTALDANWEIKIYVQKGPRGEDSGRENHRKDPLKDLAESSKSRE